MDTLERRLADLRRQRVDIRNRIKWAELAIGDVTDRRAFVATQQARLAGTDHEHAELCYLLGQEHRLRPPVKLTAPPVKVRYAPVAQRVAPRVRSGIGYFTKDMRAGGR